MFLDVCIDVALYVGFGWLLLRNGDVLDRLADADGGTRSRSDAGGADEAATSAN